MNRKILEHFVNYGMFTYPGAYEKYLRDELPNDVSTLGRLLSRQAIHRVILEKGNVGSNADMKYGDMTKVPWWQQCEDDYLPTALSMFGELFRRDSRGLTEEREPQHKLIVTCRFVSVMMASILKAKGIPARVRSGFADYFVDSNGKSVDHWINQYWSATDSRWITIDVDGCLEDYLDFDPFDMPEKKFDFPADTWFAVRQGRADEKHFFNSGGNEGLKPISWALIYDFHSLFNREIIYMHGAKLTANRFESLNKTELEQIDKLAELMLDPDKNFIELLNLWENNRDFRLLKGALL